MALYVFVVLGQADGDRDRRDEPRSAAIRRVDRGRRLLVHGHDGMVAVDRGAGGNAGRTWRMFNGFIIIKSRLIRSL